MADCATEVGEAVMIYEDPYSQEKKEGMAEILEIKRVHRYGQYTEVHAMVRFWGDDRDAGSFHRVFIES